MTKKIQSGVQYECTKLRLQVLSTQSSPHHESACPKYNTIFIYTQSAMHHTVWYKRIPNALYNDEECSLFFGFNWVLWLSDNDHFNANDNNKPTTVSFPVTIEVDRIQLLFQDPSIFPSGSFKDTSWLQHSRPFMPYIAVCR